MGAHWIRVPRFFGDALMIHVAIAPLRAAGLPLVAWGPEWVTDLFQGAEGYVAVSTDQSRDYSPWGAARLLRAHRPASVISFPKSQRPLVAAWLARVPKRLGCAESGGRILCTHSVAFRKQTSHCVERYASVVRKAFPELSEAPFLPFVPREEALAEVAVHRQTAGLDPYVVFALGGNCWNKRLGLDHFVALGGRLEREGFRTVLLGSGAEDQASAEYVSQRLPFALNRVGMGGLAVSAAWTAGAKALVGGDSGMVHLSAACGTPTLTVFGPTRPQHTGPLGPCVRILRNESLPCLECFQMICSVEGHPCMNDLDDDWLWESLNALLKG
jgi:ADP-heptose:LPS heptosyltransferase